MTAVGQLRRTTRLEPEVGFRRLEPPSVNHRIAGRPMTSAAEGVDGIRRQIMHTAIQSYVGFAKAPWNKARLIGQKRPLRPKEVWAIRVRLQLEQRRRDLALFNLAIDSKLRGCDLVRLRVSDVCVGDRVQDRATVIQQKPGGQSSSRSPNNPSSNPRLASQYRPREQPLPLSEPLS
jgi:hypothetical protein